MSFSVSNLFSASITNLSPYHNLSPNAVKSTKRVEVGSKPMRYLNSEFPLAKPEGPISKELHEIWEARSGISGRDGNSQPHTIYEKVLNCMAMCVIQIFLSETKLNLHFTATTISLRARGANQ